MQLDMASGRPVMNAAKKIGSYAKLNRQGCDNMEVEDGQIIEDSPLRVEVEEDDFHTDNQTETISSTGSTPTVVEESMSLVPAENEDELDYAKDEVWQCKEAAIEESRRRREQLKVRLLCEKQLAQEKLAEEEECRELALLEEEIQQKVGEISSHFLKG